MQFENDPFYLNFKNYTSGMEVNDTKHIEIDDNFSVFLIKVGDNQYTGWYYWEINAAPTETFTNATMNRIVEIGYEANVLKTYTAGEVYNDYMTNKLETSVSQPVFDVATESESNIGSEVALDNSDGRSTKLGINTIINPKEVWIDEVNSDEIKITIKKSEENTMENDPFNSEFKLTDTVDDFYNNKVNTRIDDTVVKYREQEKKITEALTKLDFKTPSKEEVIVEESRTNQEILTDLWRDSKFLDKEDKAF